MNRAPIQLSISSNLARILCGIFLQPPKCSQNVHTYTEVCKAPSSMQAPRVPTPPQELPGFVCAFQTWREGEKKKKSVQSPAANCLREHQCVQALCFGVPFFPRACLPSPTSEHLKWGLQTRFEMRSRVTRPPGWSGMRDAAWEPGPAGTSSPQEATGGSCGSAQGCQSRRGGGEGGKYTVAKRWWKGKGRFYKFLNFMTMLQQCNVHSICCEVSTENMHWAY